MERWIWLKRFWKFCEWKPSRNMVIWVQKQPNTKFELHPGQPSLWWLKVYPTPSIFPMNNCFKAVHSILKVNAYKYISEHIQCLVGVTVCLRSTVKCFQGLGEEERHSFAVFAFWLYLAQGGWYFYNQWKNIVTISI